MAMFVSKKKFPSIMKKNLKHSVKKGQSQDIEWNTEGVEYPLDIWFLISEYIHPETVGTFASICKSSYEVVKTGKFWFHLYKRYYRAVPNLPKRLKPECMVRMCSLRACVIRTLHFTYFPMRNTINSKQYFTKKEPHSLVNRRCSHMWHTEESNRCYFFFKLKEMPNRHNSKASNSKLKNDRINSFENFRDVFENAEEGCQILIVACLAYQMVPISSGLVLQFVKLDLSPGFRHYRLQLNFGNTYIPKIPTQTLVLHGVIDCKVLDWWHPSYPHHEVVSNSLPVMQSWESHVNAF